MNLLAALAGALTLLAFGVHAVVGAHEFRQFAPTVASGSPRTGWLQALAGWHWVSVDLLAGAVLFLVIAFTDTVLHEATALLLLAGYFALVGTAWLVTLAVAGQGVRRRYLVLGQWLFCWVVAALAFVAR
ncbi:MAG: hypothetical protein AAF809_11180 [Bacteroidota bacterium]